MFLVDFHGLDFRRQTSVFLKPRILARFDRVVPQKFSYFIRNILRYCLPKSVKFSAFEICFSILRFYGGAKTVSTRKILIDYNFATEAFYETFYISFFSGLKMEFFDVLHAGICQVLTKKNSQKTQKTCFFAVFRDFRVFFIRGNFFLAYMACYMCLRA